MVAVQVTVCLFPLCCVAALVIDGGMMMEARRRVQAAADSAALAAAADLYTNYGTNAGLDTGGTAKASAVATAKANGFSSSNATVTVNIPPTSGSSSGKAGYAEVIVVYNMTRGFSAILGSGTLPIQSRAVARGLWTSFGNGIILLAPTGQSLSDSGNGSVTVNGANIVVDSSSSQAASASGNASLTATDFVITGSPGDVTSGHGMFVGGIDSGATPTVDPMNYLTAPNPSSLTVQSTSQYSVSSNKTATINPGVYVGGISVTSGASLVMNPGIYYMSGGGFSTSGNGTITGAGVMIYNAPNSTSDVVSITGNGAVNISPPTSGVYSGISIFQDRTSAAPMALSGNGSMNISGTIYAAASTMSMSGNGSYNSAGSQFLGYKLVVSGNGNLTVNWNSTATARTRSFGLVE
jgi:hypothetical protein